MKEARVPAIASVRGTRFSVDIARDATTRVEVTEGSVEVESSGKTVIVNAALTAIVTGSALLIATRVRARRAE